jgi:hypothetical protein
MVSLCSVGDPISVANMIWMGTHRGFALRVYFENNRSVVAFRRQLNIPRNNAVPNGMEEIVEEEELRDVWFQQDGAVAHTARNSINVFERNFSRTSGLSEGVMWSGLHGHQI